MESLNCFIFEDEFNIMKRIFLLFACNVFLMGCDDGDIIVSDFNFDVDSDLNLCEFQGNRKVLHIVTESNEAISLTFEQNILENIEGVIRPGTFSVPINNSNRINYRRLDATVNSDDYFCQEIPPSNPNVLEEFVSTSGGSVEFEIIKVSGPDVDTDDDGIPDVDESGPNNDIFNYDTDEDGIPNFLDRDDDNDNIPTITEIGGENAPDIALDSDDDGVPNYLDTDDDGDGVITRYEDLNALDQRNPPNQTDLNPRDDDSNGNGIPNYLDPTSTESLTVDFFRNNILSRRFNITVVFNNITLENVDSERTIRLNSQGFGIFQIDTTNETIEIEN